MAENQKHLLLVEDEAPLRQAVAERLADHGFVVVQAASGEQALEELAEFAFDVVVTDLRLPGIDGTRVIEAAVQRYPDIIAIVITGYGTLRDAVDVIRRGATDFVTKPFQFEELLHALKSALEQRRLKSENVYLRAQLQERYRFEGIVGRSRAMRDLFQVLETVANTASTILVTGETGTGKKSSLGRSTTTVRGGCQSIGMSSTFAPSVSKIRLTLAFCSAKPIWMPRNPKLMFQISQKLSLGLGRSSRSPPVAGFPPCRGARSDSEPGMSPGSPRWTDADRLATARRHRDLQPGGGCYRAPCDRDRQRIVEPVAPGPSA